MRHCSFRRMTICLMMTAIALALSLSAVHVRADGNATLITDKSPGPAVLHGLSKVEAALTNRGWIVKRTSTLDDGRKEACIVAGLSSGNGLAASLLADLDVAAPTQAESLLIKRVTLKGQNALLVVGADDRGLMYALLDVADRIGWATDPDHLLSEVRDTRERPFVGERALSIYTMHRAYFESRLYDERFDEMSRFWPSVYEVINRVRPGIRVDARAKAFPDELIYTALDMGLNLRMCTKYWMEQMGMPWHPTHIHPNNQHDRRHGYADMLRYPKRYDMHWKLWNAGSNKVLLWGDPDFVRRFAASTHLYDGQGFEVNEPSATKMALHPEEPPCDFLTSKYRFYDYEFERFWHFFQLFGRLSYNPDTPPEVWQKQFERRFGPDAAPYVERGVHRASRILPRIIGYTYPYNHFPTLSGWPEKQRQEDLPVYARALPSDTQQFLSIEEAARNLLAGEDSAKVLPRESSQWFAKAAEDVLSLVAQAEQQVGEHRNLEFVTTMTDLRILAHLAEYHSHRALAGVRWALFKETNDLNALNDAIQYERRAVQAWERLVQAAGDQYQDYLMVGRDSGHWKDELVKLKAGLAKLEETRRAFTPDRSGTAPKIAHVPVRRAEPGQEITLRATIAGPEPVAEARVGYRDQTGTVELVPMTRVAPFVYSAVIPSSSVQTGLQYFIEATDNAGRQARWPERAVGDAVSITVTDDDLAPALSHTPVAKAPAERPLRVTAKVSDPSGVKWVRLRYRSVNQHQDYRTLEMRPTGSPDEYAAVVPGEHIVSQWDFMYLFEVMDAVGNGKIYSDLEKETPYIVVRLQRTTQ